MKPPQQFPPIYPFQQDHFLPSDQYHPHSQEDHHQQTHDHNHHGSIRPLHNYKLGLCPHQDEDFFKGPIFHGVHNDKPIGKPIESREEQRRCLCFIVYNSFIISFKPLA